MRKERLETIAGWIAVVLMALQLLLILLSWILDASSSSPTVNSLLSEEGIRWFIGQYTFFLTTPVLLWLLLLSADGRRFCPAASGKGCAGRLWIYLRKSHYLKGMPADQTAAEAYLSFHQAGRLALRKV